MNTLIYTPSSDEWIASEKSKHNLRDNPSEARITKLMESLREHGWQPYTDQLDGTEHLPAAHWVDGCLHFLRGNQRRIAIKRVIESGNLGKLSDFSLLNVILVENAGPRELDQIAADDDAEQLKFDQQVRWKMYQRFRKTHRMGHRPACVAIGSPSGDQLLFDLFALQAVDKELVERWESGEKIRRDDIAKLARCARAAKDDAEARYAAAGNVTEPETLRDQMMGLTPAPTKGRTTPSTAKADAVQAWLKGKGYLNHEGADEVSSGIIRQLARMLLAACGRKIEDGKFVDTQANSLLDAEMLVDPVAEGDAEGVADADAVTEVTE